VLTLRAAACLDDPSPASLGSQTIRRYRDDALALHVVDHLLTSQTTDAAAVHVTKELQDVRLADVTTATSDLDCSAIFGEQIGHGLPQAQVDVVAVHALKALDLLDVLENADAVLYQNLELVLE
jgi:hypothetical protein